MFVYIILTFFIVSSVGNVFADHGSGGGGSCSGDCAPPTMGQDNSGREYVEGGFTINGMTYDVLSFSQDIPTQVITTDEPVTITLKIYENSGPNYLSHVGLMLGMEERFIDGIKVDSHPVQINWDQTYDGDTSIGVDDANDLVSEVDVGHNLIEDEFGNKNTVNEISFTFTPTKPFDVDTVVVAMWDYERNSWTNYFYDSMIIEIANPSTNNEEEEPPAQIPSWFKNNAGFWAQNQIDDETFANGIKFLIKEKIMNVPNLQKFEPKPLLHFIDIAKGTQHYIDRYYTDDVYKEWFDSNFPEYTIEEAVGMPSDLVIPEWVKANAKLWTNDSLSDKEFLSGIEFLIENGIILL